MRLEILQNGELTSPATVKCPVCHNHAKVVDIPEDAAPGLADWIRCPSCNMDLYVGLGFTVVTAGI